MIKILRGAIVVCAFASSQVQAASAVALGTWHGGKPYYSFWHHPAFTEADVRNHAVEVARLDRARNVRIVASTSKQGFGAILMFLKPDKTLEYAVALAAPTWEAAVNEAKRKAKNLGGTAFKVVRGWNDALPNKQQPIIMQKL